MIIDLNLVKLLIEKKAEDGNYLFSAYKIEKESGFSRDVLSKLRNGNKDLNNITLGKIIDLSNFAEKHKNELGD